MPWDEVVRWADCGGFNRRRPVWIIALCLGCVVRIVVTSASGVLADQVAEHALALVTGLTRSLPVFSCPG